MEQPATNPLPLTPSQTVGPFFAYSLTAEQYGYPYDSIANGSLIAEPTPGQFTDAERIYVTGQVLDGQGNFIPDALLELWQADAQGVYRSLPIEKTTTEPQFTGFGRLGTGTTPVGRFTFLTVKPGAPGAASAPHINIILFMRGSLRQLHTRLYFSDEATANQQDELLNAIPEDRRHTLIAERQLSTGQSVVYTFNIHLQGDRETVFFDL